MAFSWPGPVIDAPPSIARTICIPGNSQSAASNTITAYMTTFCVCVHNVVAHLHSCSSLDIVQHWANIDSGHTVVVNWDSVLCGEEIQELSFQWEHIRWGIERYNKAPVRSNIPSIYTAPPCYLCSIIVWARSKNNPWYWAKGMKDMLVLTISPAQYTDLSGCHLTPSHCFSTYHGNWMQWWSCDQFFEFVLFVV